MTTDLSSQGKYRPRKDWSTIPALVSLDENTSDNPNSNSLTPKTKQPRRSSLALGLSGLGERLASVGGSRGDKSHEKHNKRRSSIAVAFLGRHNKVIRY